jgi:hypothetical protein
MSLPTDPGRSPDEASRPEELTRPAETSAESDAPIEPEMLKQVLRQTLGGMTSTRELNPEVYAALLEVAQRHPHEPMSLDPIAMELVAACLRVQFPALAVRAALARRMSLWVAESLLADPAARQRLTELWSRLGEALA